MVVHVRGDADVVGQEDHACQSSPCAGASDRGARRSAVLVSDGVHTVGDAPRGEVRVAPHREAGRAVARAGGGRVVPVSGFRALPRRMLDLADHVLR
jgi:hypothetical protein